MSQNWNDMLNTPDNSSMYDTQDIQDNKVWAALAYLGVLFFLPLVVNNGQSRYGRFHANQGFILLLFDIVATIVSGILAQIPLIGGLLSALVSLLSLALMIIGIINAANGKAKELPVIGGLLHVFDK